jgi:hypothetical protein
LRLILDEKYEFNYKVILHSKYPEFIIKSNINKDKYYGIYIISSYVKDDLKDEFILTKCKTSFSFKNMDNVLWFKHILWFNPTIQALSFIEIRVIADPTYLSYY